MTTSTTSSTETSPQLRLTVVKHLAGGKTIDQVALITRLTEQAVLDIASHHGYPKTDSLAKAAEILERNLNDARRDEIPVGTTIPAGAASTPTPAVSHPATTEVERLEKQLAAAKAKLRGTSGTPENRGGVTASQRVTAPKGDFPCDPGCGRHFDTVQGLGLHQRQHCTASEQAAAS